MFLLVMPLVLETGYQQSQIRTGDANVAIGAYFDGTYKAAMNDNTVGSYSIAIGSGALQTANENDNDGSVAIGHGALRLQAGTGGSQHDSSQVAIGMFAGAAITTGKKNLAIGHQALTSEDTGDGNTAVGYRSLQNVNGADNNQNSGFGMGAGDLITTGTNNTCIGANTDPSANSGANQTVIGSGATGVGDNTVTLGNSAVLNVYAAEDGGAHVHCSGVSFPATQSASSGANTLDDYEEGDWSPVISDGTNNATMHGSIGGRYTKVGNKVTVTAYILVTSLGSVSGAIRVTGLPFAVADSNRNYSAFAVSSGEGLNITAGHSVNLTAWKGTSYAKVWLWDSATGGSEMTGAELSADGGFMISGSYLTT
jgi:hypothetical protein